MSFKINDNLAEHVIVATINFSCLYLIGYALASGSDDESNKPRAARSSSC